MTCRFGGVPLAEGIRRLVGRNGLVLNYESKSKRPGEPRLVEVIVRGPGNGQVVTFVPTAHVVPLDRVYEGLERPETCPSYRWTAFDLNPGGIVFIDEPVVE